MAALIQSLTRQNEEIPIWHKLSMFVRSSQWATHETHQREEVCVCIHGLTSLPTIWPSFQKETLKRTKNNPKHHKPTNPDLIIWLWLSRSYCVDQVSSNSKTNTVIYHTFIIRVSFPLLCQRWTEMALNHWTQKGKMLTTTHCLLSSWFANKNLYTHYFQLGGSTRLVL